LCRVVGEELGLDKDLVGPKFWDFALDELESGISSPLVNVATPLGWFCKIQVLVVVGMEDILWNLSEDENYLCN